MTNMIVLPITKRIEITTSIQVCPISRMNFDYKENGRKKNFSCKFKASYHVSHCGEHDCNANNKKNGDCDGYPSLFHFMDEL